MLEQNNYNNFNNNHYSNENYNHNYNDNHVNNNNNEYHEEEHNNDFRNNQNEEVTESEHTSNEESNFDLEDYDLQEVWNVIAIKNYQNKLAKIDEETEAVYNTKPLKAFIKYTRPMIELLKIVTNNSNTELKDEFAKINRADMENDHKGTSLSTISRLSNKQDDKKRMNADTLSNFFSDVNKLLNEKYQPLLDYMGDDFELTKDTVKKVLN